VNRTGEIPNHFTEDLSSFHSNGAWLNTVGLPVVVVCRKSQINMTGISGMFLIGTLDIGNSFPGRTNAGLARGGSVDAID